MSLVRLIAIVIVLGLVAVIASKVLPVFIDSLGLAPQRAAQASSDPEDRCVALAMDANSELGAAIRRFSTPSRFDEQEWDDTAFDIISMADRAQMECGCSGEACEKATEAMIELQQLVDSLDSMFRGEDTAWDNPGRRQEKINTLLREARSAS